MEWDFIINIKQLAFDYGKKSIAMIVTIFIYRVIIKLMVRKLIKNIK